MVAPSNTFTFTNTRIPQSPFLDPLTKKPAREWLFWLQNPNIVAIDINVPIGPSSGGTGTATIPNNGQLLIGNNGVYNVSYLTPGLGIGVINGPGSIEIDNTGVLSFSGDATGLTPATATTGDITLGGVLNEIHGGTNQSTYAAGDLLYASATNTLAKFAKPSANAILTMSNTGVPAWKIPKYGAFHDTTTQTAVANTPTAITYNATDYSDGISIGTPTSRVIVNTAGLYNIQFSIQFTNNNATIDDAAIWLRVNGNNVANTASWGAVPGKHAGTDGSLIMALSIFYQFSANDYFELIWMTVNGTTSITTIPASVVAPVYPASPGIILTVSDNIAA